MTIETDISDAFLKALITSAPSVPFTSNVTSPVTPVAAPLLAYTPVTGTAYLDARPILRADPEHTGYRPSDSTLRRGIFQVDAVVPDGKGEGVGLRLAGAVKDRYAIGTVLVAGSHRLQLDKEPVIASAIKDGSWVRYPVSISYLVIN